MTELSERIQNQQQQRQATPAAMCDVILYLWCDGLCDFYSCDFACDDGVM